MLKCPIAWEHQYGRHVNALLRHSKKTTRAVEGEQMNMPFIHDSTLSHATYLEGKILTTPILVLTKTNMKSKTFYFRDIFLCSVRFLAAYLNNKQVNLRNFMLPLKGVSSKR